MTDAGNHLGGKTIPSTLLHKPEKSQKQRERRVSPSLTSVASAVPPVPICTPPRGWEELRCHGDGDVSASPACDVHKYPLKGRAPFTSE